MFTQFEDKGNGVYQASDDLIAYWKSRDTCPGCDAIAEPVATVDGVHQYVCHCEYAAKWTRKS
jgi:hypothetical protein